MQVLKRLPLKRDKINFSELKKEAAYYSLFFFVPVFRVGLYNTIWQTKLTKA